MMQFFSCSGRLGFILTAFLTAFVTWEPPMAYGQSVLSAPFRTLRQCLRQFELENALAFGTASRRPLVASGALCHQTSIQSPSSCTYFFERERCGVNPNDYICQHTEEYIDRSDGLDRLNVWIVPLNLETMVPNSRRITRRMHRHLPFSALAVIGEDQIQYFLLPANESQSNATFTYYDMRLLRDLKATIYLRLAVPRPGLRPGDDLRSLISVFPAHPIDLFQNGTIYSLRPVANSQVANSNEDFLYRRLTTLLDASRPLLLQLLGEARNPSHFAEQRSLVMNHWYALYNQCIQVNSPQLQRFKDSMILLNEELQRIGTARSQR